MMMMMMMNSLGRHLQRVARAEVGRGAKWWKSPFLHEVGGHTRTTEGGSEAVAPSCQSDRKEHSIPS